MKQNMSRFCISILLLTVAFSANAQEETTKDSIKLKDKYGLRLGVDISKPAISFFNDKIKGLEIVGDFRITKNIYAATELGYYERDTEEDYINFNSKGSYIKVGGNINLYQNWGKMSNEIYVGVRYGFSTFSQTLNSYSPNFDGTYFDEHTIFPNLDFDGLTAHWAEIVIGLKVEAFNNLYLGSSISLKKMISQEQPENFKNLYIPGFERVYLNDTGFSFNYTISYLIPIFKKNK
ncbi:MAG: DUF6048 family protein [Flavobacteriaceae bacterium]|nr:DUF6048 family protein [Flavobacteriaceae bacterium]